MTSFVGSKFTSIIRRFGTATIVPKDHLAQLMFYLHCVNTVVPNTLIKEHLQDYHHYYLLTVDEIDEVLQLCLMYTPAILEGTCFFLCPSLCVDFSNEFVEVSSARETVAGGVVHERNVTGFFMMGTVQYSAKKLMAHNDNYYPQKYNSPMIRFQPWIAAMHNNERGRPIRQCRVKITPTDPMQSDKFVDNYGANVLLSFFFPIWAFVWILMSIFTDKSEDQED